MMSADVAHLHTIRAAWGSLLDEGRMRETTSRRIAGAIEGGLVSAHAAGRSDVEDESE